MNFTLRPIAILRTPFAEKFGVPRQGGLVPEAEGRVEFLPEFSSPDFVRGLEAFSHVWLITAFHLSGEWTGAATVRPPRLGGNERVGVFASRSPNRPNPLALSLVRIVAIETAPALVLRVAGVDAVDGTPVLDVKPYLPWCEAVPQADSDWAKDAPTMRPLESVLVPPAIAARIAAETPGGGGAATLALIRRVLTLELQPAYQEDSGRTYGVTLAGWNVRWRRSAPDPSAVEVVEATQVGTPETKSAD